MEVVVIGGIHDHISGSYLLTHGQKLILPEEYSYGESWVLSTFRESCLKKSKKMELMDTEGPKCLSLIVPGGFNLRVS